MRSPYSRVPRTAGATATQEPTAPCIGPSLCTDPTVHSEGEQSCPPGNRLLALADREFHQCASGWNDCRPDYPGGIGAGLAWPAADAPIGITAA